jgi:hypothetical protein
MEIFFLISYIFGGLIACIILCILYLLIKHFIKTKILKREYNCQFNKITQKRINDILQKGKEHNA